MGRLLFCFSFHTPGGTTLHLNSIEVCALHCWRWHHQLMSKLSVLYHILFVLFVHEATVVRLMVFVIELRSAKEFRIWKIGGVVELMVGRAMDGCRC